MAPVDRNEPKRANSSESTYSLIEFMREFPDDTSCLEWLWRARFAEDGYTTHCPKCERERRFHRVKDRPACEAACDGVRDRRAGRTCRRDACREQVWLHAPLEPPEAG